MSRIRKPLYVSARRHLLIYLLCLLITSLLSSGLMQIPAQPLQQVLFLWGAVVLLHGAATRLRLHQLHRQRQALIWHHLHKTSPDQHNMYGLLGSDGELRFRDDPMLPEQTRQPNT